MNFVKTSIYKDNYTNIKQLNDFYIVHIMPEENGDYIDCIEFMVNEEPSDTDLTNYEQEYKNKMFVYLKTTALDNIAKYDSSDVVNSFVLNGDNVWFNKADRVGLMNSTTIQKNSGLTETTLWFNNNTYTVPIDQMLQLLAAVELYALECYNVTARHMATVNSMTTYEEIINYDYTTGYPQKINITI